MSNNEADRLAEQIKLNIGWNNHKLACAGVDQLAALAKQQASPQAEMREALRDMLAGWKYIREHHGDLRGVGWDRAQKKAEAALAKLQAPEATAEPAAVPPNSSVVYSDLDTFDAWLRKHPGRRFMTPIDAETLDGFCFACITELRKVRDSALAAHGTQKAEAVAITEWRKAEKKRLEAVAAYNAALERAKVTDASRGFGFTNVNDEYQAMNKAGNEAHRLQWAALAALYATPPSTPQAAPPAQAEPMSALQAAYDRLHNDGFKRIEDWFIRDENAPDTECIHIDTIAILAEAGIKEKT